MDAKTTGQLIEELHKLEAMEKRWAKEDKQLAALKPKKWLGHGRHLSSVRRG